MKHLILGKNSACDNGKNGKVGKNSTFSIFNSPFCGGRPPPVTRKRAPVTRKRAPVAHLSSAQ